MVFRRGYQYLHWLSLEIAFGAIVLASFLSSALSVSVSLDEMLLLGLSVFVLYNVDHLLDTRGKEMTSERRIFFQKYFWLIIFLIAIASCFGIFLLLRSNLDLFIYGSILLTLSVGYFYTIQKNKSQKIYHKECFGAMLYTLGIFLIPLSQSNLVSSQALLLFFEMYGVILLNILIFSLIDSEEDLKNGQLSLINTIGIRKSNKLIRFLIVVTYIVPISIMILELRIDPVQTTILIISVLTSLIYFKRDNLRINDRYRVIGDSLFYIPLVYLLF